MSHALDQPVWSSLQDQPHWADGGALARRFKPDINRFAAARDDGADSLAALAELVRPGDDVVYLAQARPVVVPPGLVAVKAATAVQMVAARAVEADEAGLQLLGDADAAEMLALATLTEPGPFLARTHTMGHFIGLRIGGRLAAMAGERMRFPGHVEVSGVCTHPDFRGRGLARRLSAAVTAAIQRRDAQPFLHAWTTNTAAIALYASLGFATRTTMNVAVLRRSGWLAERTAGRLAQEVVDGIRRMAGHDGGQAQHLAQAGSGGDVAHGQNDRD